MVVTLELGLVVDQVDATVRKIEAAVAREEGYVSDVTLSGDVDERRARMQLRVPAARARAVRDEILGMGEVASDVERAEEVTEQRADLNARLANARTQEKRVLEIMSSKTGTLREVMEAETELARVRENVERLEAQERTLSGKVAMATLTVSAVTRSVAAWKTPIGSVRRAGWHGLQIAAGFFTYAAMTAAAIAPTVLPVVLIGYGLLRYMRRRREAR